MSGIVFFGTNKLDELKNFYINEVGCDIWLEQADCIIFRHGNFLLGFCRRAEADITGIVTFFFDSREEVDRFYKKFSSTAENPPAENEKYRIYHFFTRDPEGRKVEFQYFLHPVDMPE